MSANGMELREALHLHLERLRTRLAEYPVVDERRLGTKRELGFTE
jgi:hypothetical protein